MSPLAMRPKQMHVPGIPSEHELAVFNTMAKQAVESKMYRGIGDLNGVMMIMLTARELSIPVMQALNGGLNIINGKVEISARMMNALIRKAGHHITIQESTESSCTLVGKRGDTSDSATVSYTFEEAQKAGLVKPGGGWVKNPKDMCFARALSRLARQLFSDVIGIGYIEGEISGKDVEVADSIAPLVEEVQPSESEWLNKYLELFQEDEQSSAHEYLKVVMGHFDWTKIQAIKELLKDEKKLFDKFNTWKNKVKK